MGILFRTYLIVNDVGNFIEGMGFEEFIKDKKTIYSVVRAIEIIGEATKNVPEQIRKKYPDVPWKKMAGMRRHIAYRNVVRLVQAD
jgi:uncharacterized protein with HEPN domain